MKKSSELFGSNQAELLGHISHNGCINCLVSEGSYDFGMKFFQSLPKFSLLLKSADEFHPELVENIGNRVRQSSIWIKFYTYVQYGTIRDFHT